MRSNDSIILDGIIADRQQKDGLSDGDAFERFAFEQVLKDYAPTANHIDDGWVDGGGDGGIDGFYVVVNGYLYGGESDFQWPRENPHITLWVFTCKHNEEFIAAPLESMHATLSELLDCGIPNGNLRGVYSDALLDVRSVFLKAYNELARLDPKIDIKFVYASRGDSSVVSDFVRGRMEQLESLAHEKFDGSSVECSFIGSRDLLRLYRKAKAEDLTLHFEISLTHDENNYVVIAKLRDYYDFVRDGEGGLRRYLFDSNVRDFLGYNNVNSDIDYTLKNPDGANFWWLNNGITILASNAHLQGKNLYLNSVQIVNGLQTTETVYRHFAGGSMASLDSNILIKVLTSQDESLRRRIVQATNNQSNVMSYSLHAGDAVQRNIEIALRRENYFYERRDHYYKNEGAPNDREITPLELAKAFVAVVYRNPAEASRLKNRFMRNSVSYNAVFNSDFPADRWPALASVWLATGRIFEASYAKRFGDVSYHWRPLVAFCSVAILLARFDFTIKDISNKDWHDGVDSAVEESWRLVVPFVGKFGATSRNRLKNPRAAYDTVLKEIALIKGLSGVDVVNRRKLERVSEEPSGDAIMTEEFIESVRALLPSQPWKPGVHREVCVKLGVRSSHVTEAIQILIERGIVHEQRNGIVYDSTGSVLMVDPCRCSFSVAELNKQLEHDGMIKLGK